MSHSSWHFSDPPARRAHTQGLDHARLSIGIGAGTQALIFSPLFVAGIAPDPFGHALLMGAGWVINLGFVEWRIRKHPAARRDCGRPSERTTRDTARTKQVRRGVRRTNQRSKLLNAKTKPAALDLAGLSINNAMMVWAGGARTAGAKLTPFFQVCLRADVFTHMAFGMRPARMKWRCQACATKP